MTRSTTEHGAALERAPLLCAAGRTLYGSTWQTDLARALDVSPRALRYWVAGRAMPPDMPKRLLVVIARREHELRELRATLIA